jgi:DNA-binding response OmpR family regulator
MSVPDAEYFPFLERKLPLLPARRMNSPLNILLAEDECSVAFSICFALRPDGHKIEIVTDGGQALAEVTGKPGAFDLLITDHSMPRMSGVELVKRLRETDFSGKVLVLSAHLSAENRAAYVALGVDIMIPKPFDVHELRATIASFANGIAPASNEDAVQLSPTTLHKLLKSALEPDEAT